MSNMDIYKNALKLLGGDFDRDRLIEYTIRAPYILGCFFYDNYALDDRYRELLGCGPRKYTHAVHADLALDFPFVGRFRAAAEYYVASILVLEEDEEAGDKFHALYSDEMAEIISEIPINADIVIAVK